MAAYVTPKRSHFFSIVVVSFIFIVTFLISGNNIFVHKEISYCGERIFFHVYIFHCTALLAGNFASVFILLLSSRYYLLVLCFLFKTFLLS